MFKYYYVVTAVDNAVDKAPIGFSSESVCVLSTNICAITFWK